MSIDDRERPAGPVARRQMRTSKLGTLATIDTDTPGWPYASLVQTACSHDAAPMMLISELARHSRNIAADDRVSLLYTKVSPEAAVQSRVTVIGRAARCDDAALRERFLARHAAARNVAAFADFHLYRITVDSVHFIAGFGSIHTLAAGEVLFELGEAEALAEAEAGIVAHMNEDHGDAIDLYAHNLAGRPGMNWRMTGIDPEGIDLARHDTEARYDFEAPVCDAKSARDELVRLARKARGGNA